MGVVTVRNALCLAAVMAAERARVSESGAGVTSVTKSFVDDGSAARAERHQNFSEGFPAGQVRGKCRITSCQFVSFSCAEDLRPERSSKPTSEVRVRPGGPIAPGICSLDSRKSCHPRKLSGFPPDFGRVTSARP